MTGHVTIAHTNTTIPVLTITTTLRPAVALQNLDTIKYTYDYTATGPYSALSELVNPGTNLTISTTPVTSFTLLTNAYTLFVFVQDILGNQNVSLISNGTTTATCNAGGTVLTANPLGYFKLTTACTTDLTIDNF